MSDSVQSGAPAEKPAEPAKPAPKKKHTLGDVFRALSRPRIAAMLALGFSSGLPFLLTSRTLGFWLRDDGIDLKTIAALEWVGFAYTFKFLWAPLLDSVRVPFLDEKLGKRRAWMVVSQVILMLSIFAMSTAQPSASILTVTLFALVVAFAAATQDIAVDAWRIEAAPNDEQGLMAAAYQFGYRFALIAAGAGALYLADIYSWNLSYVVMALLMGLGVVAAILAPRPLREDAREEKTKLNPAVWLAQKVTGPFQDFFTRYGKGALALLALIALYRLPEFLIGPLSSPFYHDLGFTKSEVASVTKLYGVWVGLFAAAVAGLCAVRFGLYVTVVIGAISQATGVLAFAWLAGRGHDVGALTLAISAENFGGGFAGAALIAYMSSLTSPLYTATQYALFSSLYAFLGKLLAGFTGFLVEDMQHAGGDLLKAYGQFFILCAAAGIPAVILAVLSNRFKEREI